MASAKQRSNRDVGEAEEQSEASAKQRSNRDVGEAEEQSKASAKLWSNRTSIAPVNRKGGSKSLMNQKYKRLFWIFCAAAGSFLLLIMLLVIYIDPFFHYHKPREGFPYVVDNQLSQNPGMAAHMDYDSVILGSSMTVNFETTWFQELMDLKTIKLCYSGAFPKDQSNIMSVIFNSTWNNAPREVKKVFLGVDVITYTGEVDQTKYPIPEYLYDDNDLNDIQYLLNKDVLLNYVLRPMADPDPTDLSHVYASWWTDEYYSEDWVLHNYVPPIAVDKAAEKDEFLLSVSANLDQNICPYIEQNPDTEFVVFFPPYSILFWNDVLMENHLEATMEEYRYIAERLNAYENVRVYFFPAEKEIVTNLNHYADYSHYHPKYNRFMTECFANGTDVVAKEGQSGTTMDEYLQTMQSIVDTYDFDALRAKMNYR